MAYDNEKKFVLFKNDKGENEMRPDYRGTFTLEGEEWEIAGWIKTSKKDGTKFIGGVIKLKVEKKTYQKAAAEANPEPARRAEESFDEDVPF